MLDFLAPYIAWDLSRYEVYGLFFLLGSFAVATLSDVKHMSAQREFMDVWWAFAAAILFVQLWQEDFRPDGPLITKWLLVVVLSALSHRKVGLWLRLATADVAAIAAAASLLSPGLVVAYFVILKLVAIPAAFLLARGRPAYPFMPVILAATFLLVAYAFGTGVVN